MAGATARALRRCGAARGKEEKHFNREQKQRMLPPNPTPAPQEAGSPLPQVRSALSATCTSPAPGFRQPPRVAQPAGAKKVTLLRPRGPEVRDTGRRAGQRCSCPQNAGPRLGSQGRGGSPRLSPGAPLLAAGATAGGEAPGARAATPPPS